MSGRLRVGTSGWQYRDWRRIYGGAPSRQHLALYARRFETVEVNSTFYHLPRPATYERWADETPDGFVFALKLSRFVTHVKRLRAKAATRTFLGGARLLAEKLGPVLVQLPPSSRADPLRLGRFLAATGDVAAGLGLAALRLAFEFRHASWFESRAALDALAASGAALVFGHSSRYPYPEAEPRTAPFVYLRFHGPRELFASRYGRRGLAPFAAKIGRWLRGGADVYAYFNNDARGHALADAEALRELVETGVRRPATRGMHRRPAHATRDRVRS